MIEITINDPQICKSDYGEIIQMNNTGQQFERCISGFHRLHVINADINQEVRGNSNSETKISNQ